MGKRLKPQMHSLRLYGYQYLLIRFEYRQVLHVSAEQQLFGDEYLYRLKIYVIHFLMLFVPFSLLLLRQLVHRARTHLRQVNRLSLVPLSEKVTMLLIDLGQFLLDKVCKRCTKTDSLKYFFL